MINDSVSTSYYMIDSLAKQVAKAEKEGLPKNVVRNKKVKKGKGLLARSTDMLKNQVKPSEDNNEDKVNQKLVIAYLLRIRQAFEEVRNGRRTTS